MSAASPKPVIYAALVGNALIAVTKFVAGVFTGSSAMLAEGVHSVVDTGNQALLLYGLHRSRKPADAAFPFGYGKEVYFWSFVVAIQLFTIGAGVAIGKGVLSLLHPEPLRDVGINYVVIGLSLLFEGASWLFAVSEFSRSKGKWTYLQAIQRGKDPSRFLVIFEDSAAVLGLLIALVAILLQHYTGINYFDGAASIAIGLVLAATAIMLGRETKGLLIGESANPAVVEDIRRLAAAMPEVRHVNEVLTLHMGPNYILVNLSIAFAPELPAVEVERCIAALDGAIKQAQPRVKRLFVEAEPRFDA